MSWAGKLFFRSMILPVGEIFTLAITLPIDLAACAYWAGGSLSLRLLNRTSSRPETFCHMSTSETRCSNVMLPSLSMSTIFQSLVETARDLDS